MVLASDVNDLSHLALRVTDLVSASSECNWLEIGLPDVTEWAMSLPAPDVTWSLAVWDVNDLLSASLRCKKNCLAQAQM